VAVYGIQTHHFQNRLNLIRKMIGLVIQYYCAWAPRGERGALGSDEPGSASFSGLVETGESRTPNTDHPVAAALRELSVCLARLADTLDWTDHTSKHNQRTDH